VELALDTGVHRKWRTFFRAVVCKYALLDHLDDAIPSEPTPSWYLLDATVVSWIYRSVSLGLLDAVMTPGEDPAAAELWDSINGLFSDHKINRQLMLSAELGDISMGDLSMTDYLQKLKTLGDSLADLDAPIVDAQMVIHCLNGLPKKYDGAADLISLMVPPLTFGRCCSMLKLQEMKRKNRRARHTDTALYTNSTSTGKGKGKKKKTPQQPKTELVSEPAPLLRRHLVLRHPPGLRLSSPGTGPSRCGHTVTAFSVATPATCRAPLLHSMRFTHKRPMGSTIRRHHRTAMATLRPTDLVIRHLLRHQPPAPGIKLDQTALLQQFQTI
jgi:hypothetical protein